MIADPGSINWAELTGELSSGVRPETRSKYFPKNPLRQALLNRFLDRTAKILSTFAWQSLLDVGCGEGFVDYYLDKRFPGRAITGADPDPVALEVARKINPSHDFIAADGRDLPFPDHSFDAVICNEVLEHLPDYRSVMEEVRRVSRGPCLFSVPAWPFYQAANFTIGKNWSRLGEHPDHVVQFSGKKLKKELESVFNGPAVVSFSFPWLIGLSGV